jgi:hypothetical protein
LNRVDATIIFRSLTPEEIKQIVDLELVKVSERLIEHAITLDVTEEARAWLAEKGYDSEFGARPLRRLIQTKSKIHSPMASCRANSKLPAWCASPLKMINSNLRTWTKTNSKHRVWKPSPPHSTATQIKSHPTRVAFCLSIG